MKTGSDLKFICCSYDETTGAFTVPLGGDGLYYLSIYILVQGGENAEFNIVVNGVIVCTGYGDESAGGSDQPTALCSAVVDVVAGMTCSSVSEELFGVYTFSLSIFNFK